MITDMLHVYYNRFFTTNCLLADEGWERKKEKSMEMKSILIKDTTKEQREQIVADSIGNINGGCDGCMSGLADMYQDYIDGKREIREINMEFRARYESGIEGPEKTECGYKQ